MMWPSDFARIPCRETWVDCPVEDQAYQYDAVRKHGWYRNLDPVLDCLHETVQDDDIVIDYSAGTGILGQQFLGRNPNLNAGYLMVDASAKFLRLALEKLGDDQRTAFRRLRYLKDDRRLQYLDEVLPESLRQRGVDTVCSTNAIHLYYNLPETLESWTRFLTPGGLALIQSGNIDNPRAPEGTWIIDNTVECIQPIAQALVKDDRRYAPFRAALSDAGRMEAYDTLRRKYFLPVRPLEYYTTALQSAGLDTLEITERAIEAKVADWTDFLNAYHEGILGWAGGSIHIDGEPPSSELVTLRKQLLADSLSELFSGAESFHSCWTYIRCRKPKS